MNFSERLSYIIKELGCTVRAVEQRIGCANGVIHRCISKNTTISTQWVSKLIEEYPTINPTWLLTGRGKPLFSKQEDSRNNSHNDDYALNSLSNNMTTINKTNRLKPRIPFTAAAGALSEAAESAELRDCTLMPLMECLPEYDFTMAILGDSMFPDFQSGDEVACRFIRESNYIQWGRVHILDTRDGAVIKRIYNNGEYITCKSINPLYPEFDIPKSDILQMALVVGFARSFG